jgi:hypothetical protein
MSKISIMSAHNTDPSPLGDASIVGFILTLGLLVCRPSEYIISGTEQTVLFRIG